jgi:hypothetical protein
VDEMASARRDENQASVNRRDFVMAAGVSAAGLALDAPLETAEAK